MMLARLAFMMRPYRDGLGLFVTRSKMPTRSRRMRISYRVEDTCASGARSGRGLDYVGPAGVPLEDSWPWVPARGRDCRPTREGYDEGTSPGGPPKATRPPRTAPCRTFHGSRREHLERTGAAPVFEGGSQRRDLPVQRDLQPGTAGFHAGGGDPEQLELLYPVHAAPDHLPPQSEQAAAAGRMHEVDRQHATLERLPRG